MSEYRCPTSIQAMFSGADEEQKGKARLAAFEWLHTLPLEVGDVIYMPNPRTGELERWGKTGSPTAH